MAHESKSLYLNDKTSLGLAIMYQSQSDYKKAAPFYKEGIKFAEKLNNKPMMAKTYN